MILQRLKPKHNEKDFTLDYFIADIQKYSILPNEEIIPLVKAAQEGDLEARHKVHNSNYKILLKEALRHYNSGTPLVDLIQEGFLGLDRAIDHFNFGDDVTFYYFATCCVSRQINAFLKKYGTTVVVPENVRPKLHALAKATASFIREKNRLPVVSELEELTKIPHELVEIYCSLYSLDFNLDELDIDDIESNAEPLIEEDKDDPLNDLIDQVPKMLDILDKKDRDFICRYFGIGITKRPVEVLAKELGRSTEWVRLQRVRILQKLKDNCPLDSYLS